MAVSRILKISSSQIGRQICIRSLSSVSSLDSIRKQMVQYEGGSVDLEMDDGSGLAVVTLNNAEKMNALTGQMMVQLSDRVTQLESWDGGKGVILRGEGKTFCSGGDLATVREICDPENGYRMSSFMQDIMKRFYTLPLLTFALIEGRALGGGAELATACDFCFMTESAKIGFVQGRMGVTTGWGGGTRLVRLLGRSEALSLLCMGKVLDANTSKNIGLVHHILCESDDALGEAREIIQKTYCGFDTAVVRAIKKVVLGACNTSNEESLVNERNVFRTTWGGPLQLAALGQNIKHK